MSDLVLEPHRPTAPELLAPLPRSARWVIVGTFAAVVLGIVVALVVVPDDGTDYVQRQPIEFNLRYPPEFERVKPQGDEFMRIERRRGGLFIDGFAVAPLALPSYDGDIAGALPILAEQAKQDITARFRDAEIVQEGKTRLNEVPGYTVVFRARIEAGRRLNGRLVLLPEVVAKPRRGVQLLIIATPSAGVFKAEDAGVHGLSKRPFRTFRFGTEKP